MNDLKTYTMNLIQAGIIDLKSVVSERDGKWIVTKPFAGIPVNTTFQNEQEYRTRIVDALVSQAQAGGLRVAV